MSLTDAGAGVAAMEDILVEERLVDEREMVAGSKRDDI